MNLTFRSDLTAEEHDRFVLSLPHYNVTQTAAWPQIKTEWQSFFCGLFDGEKQVGGALVLLRKIMPAIRVMYIPRGFLCDWSSSEQVSAFAGGLKKFAAEKKAYLVRIDPEIVISETAKGEKKEIPEGMQRMENLKNAGFLHKGFAMDFTSYTQPRFNAEYFLTEEDGQPKSDEVILSGFDKKLKKFIGRYTAERGIAFRAAHGSEAADLFHRISEHTEQRQHILLRDGGYFRRMAEAFGDNCTFFFAEMNLDAFMAFCREKIEKENDERAKEDLALAESLRKESETAVLSSLLVLESLDTAYLMYRGFDDTKFSRFRTTNQIRYEAMRYYRDKGLKTFSFMGIHGDLSGSLSDFKMKFNPTIVEFAGEFELPVKPIRYHWMDKAFPVMKNAYINLMLRLKGKK